MIRGWTSPHPQWDGSVGSRLPPPMGWVRNFLLFLWFCLVFLGFPLVLLGFPWFSPAAPLWSVTPGGPARRPPCGTSCPGGWPAAPLWNVRRRPARRRKTKENQRKTKQNQRKTKQNQGKPRKTKKIRGIPLGGGACSLRTSGDPSHWGGLQPTTPYHI